MNILDLKRKSLGWVALEPGDSTGGGEAHGPPTSAGVGPSNPSSPSYGGSGHDVGGWSLGGPVPSLSIPNYSIATGQAPGATATISTSADPGGSLTTSNPGYVTGTGGGARVSVDPQSYQLGTLDGRSEQGFTQSQIDSWAGMSPVYQARFNVVNQLPSYYNHADPGLREAAFDATNPSKWGLLNRLGFRGLGVTQDNYIDNETESQRNDRMGLVGNAINRVGMTAFNAVPGGGAVLTAARALDAVQNRGWSVADAAKTAAFDIGGGLVASNVNKAVMGAIGADGRAAVGQYNTLASIANLGAPGTLPSVNPGGLLVSGAAQELGYKAFGKPSGMTMPDGRATVTAGDIGGWSSGGGSAAHKDLAPAMQVEDQTPEELSTFTPRKFKDISYADWKKDN